MIRAAVIGFIAIVFGPAQLLAAQMQSCSIATPLWKLERKVDLIQTVGDEAASQSIAFSSDGVWVTTASNDQKIRIWNAVTGQKRLEASSGLTPPWTSVFTKDQKRLVLSGFDGDTFGGRVLDSSSGVLLRRMPAITRPALTKNSALFHTNDPKDPYQHALIDAVTGKSILRWKHHPYDEVAIGALVDGSPSILRVSNTGALSMVTESGETLIGTFAENDIGKRLKFGADPQFAPELHRAYNAGVVWNTATKSEAFRLPASSTGYSVQTAQFSSVGGKFLYGAANVVQVVRADTGQAIAEMCADTPIWRPRFSDDGTLVIGETQKATFVWDARTGVLLARAPTEGSRFWSTAINASTQVLGTTEQNGRVTLWYFSRQ